MKICILGASFITGNMGVGALTCGIVQGIRNNLPESEIILLDYSREPAEYPFRHGNGNRVVKMVNMRFSKNVLLGNHIGNMFVVSALRKLLKRLDPRRDFPRNGPLREMATSDIVVSIAGGDSFSDLYGPVRFYYVSLPQIVALLLGKKLVLLPQTLGPFQRRATKIVARYILNRAHLVYSRDRGGIEETREFLGNGAGAGRLRFCYDAGFLVKPEKPGTIGLPEHVVERGSGRPLVGVNVSGLLYMGGYTKDNMFKFRTDYRVLVRDLIGMLVTEIGADVVLVPHVFGESPDTECDRVACRKVFVELAGKHGDRIFFPDARYDQNEIKYIIGLCDFFVGSRMHACIAALSQNIPAVAIAYSRKFHGVLQTIGAEDLVADPRTLEKEEILRVVRDGFRRRAEIRKHLERVIPSVESAVNDLFDPQGPIFQ